MEKFPLVVRKMPHLPDVRDVNVLLEAIADTGAIVERRGRHDVRINGATINNYVVENNFIKKMRASYYLLGAMLGKYHHAEVSLPGGCDIGSRPIDQHLKGFRAPGATAVVRNGMIVVDSRQLTGAHIYFDMVSVGATINVGGNDGKRKNSFRKCSKRATCGRCRKFTEYNGSQY